MPFELGTDVSAKYRGAWCEGVVKHVQRSLNIKVYSDGTLIYIYIYKGRR